MNKFTEGPWVAEGSAIKAGEEHIITAWGLEGRVNEERLEGESWLEMRGRTFPARVAAGEEGDANAHLIAAAPEMYEALEYQKGCMESSDYDLLTFLHMRDAALSKARGEA